MREIQKWGIALLAIAATARFSPSEACTRVVYQGKGNTVLTGRTMDWKEDTRSNLWIFPRGMQRNGEIGKNPLEWTSKYGSVITSAYDICSTDGMNEKGLPNRNTRSGTVRSRDFPLPPGFSICWIILLRWMRRWPLPKKARSKWCPT